jgi:hypothetical protein
MAQFDSKECGELYECVAFKITRIGKSAKKTQLVILQSFLDVLHLLGWAPCQLRIMHVMQYSALHIHIEVRDLVRYMSQPAPKHTKEMLHSMKQCVFTNQIPPWSGVFMMFLWGLRADSFVRTNYTLRFVKEKWLQLDSKVNNCLRCLHYNWNWCWWNFGIVK